MPVVTVDWWSGFGEDKRRQLARSVTAAVVEVTGCRADSVTLIIRDIERDHWARGGVLAHEREAAAPEAGAPEAAAPEAGAPEAAAPEAGAPEAAAPEAAAPEATEASASGSS
ncbi:tautomerase family protein [Kitasatospora kifunensis]|uniref:4-oxalocrotonate tautomerase n=1 Tax=Kitasatospora kifunensis TaxID=58351 RepID=A0A7W7QY70_KITKI|nr:tautomerase family protein [Kitasatospora kifunensis]MBB4922000.1 4-oxalocrotonate tautomerase [Kitasatospora kifunensis]